jgi:hypothetical protein
LRDKQSVAVVKNFTSGVHQKRKTAVWAAVFWCAAGDRLKFNNESFNCLGLGL